MTITGRTKGDTGSLDCSSCSGGAILLVTQALAVCAMESKKSRTTWHLYCTRLNSSPVGRQFHVTWTLGYPPLSFLPSVIFKQNPEMVGFVGAMRLG